MTTKQRRRRDGIVLGLAAAACIVAWAITFWKAGT